MKDPTTAAVLQHIQQGWPNVVNDSLKPFSARRNELSVHNNCFLWGTRVFVPEPGREPILKELHDGHPGICKMKSLARMYVWWPGIDSDIEVPLTWKWPSQLWSRLHLDFAKPFGNCMFLLLIDAQSKWIETFPTSNSTSFTVLQCLRSVFARFGIPSTVVTDNGTCFVSAEFQAFLKSNGYIM